MLSLADKPSRMPGRRTASIGCSTAKESIIRVHMSGHSTPGVSWMISVTLRL